MTILYEIGLENEYWLLDSEDNIMEAPAFNFPADEMGFLIEIRSPWGRNPELIAKTLEAELLAQKSKAKILDFHIEAVPFKIVSEEWQEYIATKYKHAEMPNNTQNIYGQTHISHHTGFISSKATAGLHVHFSRWDTVKEAYVPYIEDEITYIVNSMDCSYGALIGETSRIAGEWEPKPYHGGFEYRSLPCTAPLVNICARALEIINGIN